MRFYDRLNFRTIFLVQGSSLSVGVIVSLRSVAVEFDYLTYTKKTMKF